MITITGKDEFSTFRYNRVTDAWFPTVSNLHNYVTFIKAMLIEHTNCLQKGKRGEGIKIGIYPLSPCSLKDCGRISAYFYSKQDAESFTYGT